MKIAVFKRNVKDFAPDVIFGIEKMLNLLSLRPDKAIDTNAHL